MTVKVIAMSLICFSTFGMSAHASAPQDEIYSEQEMIQIDGLPEPEFQSLVAPAEPNYTASDKARVLAKYSFLDPQKIVPTQLLQTAVLYYEFNYSSFSNHSYLAVYDYSARSTKVRFFIVDLKSGDVLALHSAHGLGSDSSAHNGYADKFSNIDKSKMSSLGFARTSAKTYISTTHYSTPALRMTGLSTTNSLIYSRAVVIHAAKYVFDEDVVQGRSSGCPAVSVKNIDRVTSMLVGGALIYFARSN